MARVAALHLSNHSGATAPAARHAGRPGGSITQDAPVDDLLKMLLVRALETGETPDLELIMSTFQPSSPEARKRLVDQGDELISKTRTVLEVFAREAADEERRRSPLSDWAALADQSGRPGVRER